MVKRALPTLRGFDHAYGSSGVTGATGTRSKLNG